MKKSGSTATQKDVAQLAGVSAAVVSYVINNGPRQVSDEVRQRVLEAIDQLGYHPNKYAQNLKVNGHQAQRQIGVLVGGSTRMLKRPYYGAILAGIYDEAYSKELRVRFTHFINDLTDPVLFNEHFNSDEISALIILSPHLAMEEENNVKILKKIINRIDRIVCLEKQVFDLPTVMFDREAAAQNAVEHLIRLGHQKIGFMGRPDERYTGYQLTMLNAGLEIDNQSNIFPGTQNSFLEGFDGAQTLIERGKLPTALFTSNDEIAVGAMGAFYDHHITIPDDIAIVSIDDTSIASVIRPALTTIRVPTEKMGMLALRVLETSEFSEAGTPLSIHLPTELIIRESCGADRQFGNRNLIQRPS